MTQNYLDHPIVAAIPDLVFSLYGGISCSEFFSQLKHIRQQFQIQKLRARNVELVQILIVYTLYGAPKWVQTRLTEILNSGPVGGLPTKMDKQPISHTPALSSRFVNIISNWYFSSGWPNSLQEGLVWRYLLSGT